MWFKRNWPALLAVALQAESIWKFLKWVLDWRGRYDSLAETYHEIGGASAMIGYILDPPPWFYPLAFFVGLILMWWNFHRNRRNVHIHHIEMREHAILGAEDRPLIGNPSSSIMESPPISSETIAARLRNRPEWRGKIIVDVTPEYLWNLFCGCTSMQGSTLVEQFLNKWMVVLGSFRDVSSNLIVMFAYRSDGKHLYMNFNEEWRERLALIIPGQQIAVIGRIEKVRGIMLELEDCKLV